jgi:hypothetical protein
MCSNRKDRSKRKIPKLSNTEQETKRETHIPNTVNLESLKRGKVGSLTSEPKVDLKIRNKPDHFPTNEQD